MIFTVSWHQQEVWEHNKLATVKSFQYKKDHPGVLFYRYNYGDEYKKKKMYSRLMITEYQVAKQSITIFVSYVTKWLFR